MSANMTVCRNPITAVLPCIPSEALLLPPSPLPAPEGTLSAYMSVCHNLHVPKNADLIFVEYR